MADDLAEIFKQYNSQMQAFNNDSMNSWREFTNILKGATAEVGKRTIETKIQGTQAPLYKTQITLDGSITNEHSDTRPTDKDAYWNKHNELVNEVLATRKEIILKVIETAGVTIKGIINPISFSNIDLGKLAEAFQTNK